MEWNNLLQVLLLPLECHHYQDFLYLSANKKKRYLSTFNHINVSEEIFTPK